MTMKADALAAYDRIAWGKTVAGTEAMVHDLAKIHVALQSIPTDKPVQWECSDCGAHYQGGHECTLTLEMDAATRRIRITRALSTPRTEETE